MCESICVCVFVCVCVCECLCVCVCVCAIQMQRKMKPTNMKKDSMQKFVQITWLNFLTSNVETFFEENKTFKKKEIHVSMKVFF